MTIGDCFRFRDNLPGQTFVSVFLGRHLPLTLRKKSMIWKGVAATTLTSLIGNYEDSASGFRRGKYSKFVVVFLNRYLTTRRHFPKIYSCTMCSYYARYTYLYVQKDDNFPRRELRPYLFIAQFSVCPMLSPQFGRFSSVLQSFSFSLF
jgi:hypothetical protein